MACVSVLIGQCGNQLGAQVYQAIATEAVNSNDESFQTSVSRTFFREPSSSSSRRAREALPETRSILVDMEPKVISDSIEKAERLGLFSVSPKQCVAKEEGSANNWAFGYSQQGPSRREAIAENLRKEAEEGGAVGSFQIVHSLAGGTGSGVGTLTSEIIREEFPRSILMHTAVMPFSHGEVITQWYNLIFTLSYLNETADSITLLSNDDFSRLIQQNEFNVPKASTTMDSADILNSSSKTHAHTAPTTSLHNINELMGDVVASLWLPSYLLATPELLMKNTKIGGSGGDGLSPARKRVGASTSLGGGAGRGAANAFRSDTIIRPSAISDLVEFVACDPRQKFVSASCFPSYGRALAAKYKNSTWPSVVGAAMRETVLDGADRYMLSLRGLDAFTSPNTSATLGVARGDPMLSSFLDPSEVVASAYPHPRVASATNFTGTSEIGHILAVNSTGGGAKGFANIREGGGGLASAPSAVHASNVPFRNEKAFVSLFDTSRSIGHRIAYAAHKAEKMFSVNAFTHHFHRFGVEDDHFRSVLLNSWHLARCYGDSGEGLSDDDEEDCGDVSEGGS